jgi:hypothetical protein
MGIKYSVDRKRDLIFNLWEGTVTGEEWLAQVRQLTAEPDWPAVTRMICDLRDVQDFSTIGEAEIAQAIELLRKAPGDLRKKKCAIPASEAFRIATIYQKALAPYAGTVIVFTSLETACVFLGLDLPEVQGVLGGLRQGTG